MPARCTSGSYVGNETPRSILIGWQPDVVVVKGDNGYQAFLKTVDMPAGASKGASNDAALVTSCITGFIATGFTVGADISVNQIGVTFVWFALQSAANEVATGSYVGNGIDATDIAVGLGAAPILVITMPADAADCRIRMDDYGNAFSPKLVGLVGDAVGLEALYNSGFTVGTDIDVNRVGKTYYWIAVREVAGFSTHGTYAGNGTDDRNLAVGGGVVPAVVLLTGCMTAWTGWYHPEFRVTAQAEDKCSQFTHRAFLSDNIQTMGAATFQVGQDANANANAKPYYWIAFTATSSLGRGLADIGVGLDSLTVRKSTCSSVAVAVAAGSLTDQYRPHSIVTLPNAIVLLYQDRINGVRYTFSPDRGVTWSAPVTVDSDLNLYPSAVADVCTGDIHVVYSRIGSPALGTGHSIYYRSLIYVGTSSPAWVVGAAVEIGYSSPGVGYADAALSVEEGSCSDPIVGGNAGRLVCVAKRITDTDRAWVTLVATAPWTLQGAAETVAAIPVASAVECAVSAQAKGRLYVITSSGGRYALYRSRLLDWGDISVGLMSWDGWGGDNLLAQGLGIAVDFWGSQTIQVGGVTLADREVAAVYIKNNQIYYREWSLPIDDDDVSWMTMNDFMVWSRQDAAGVCISRVGQSYWISAIIGPPGKTDTVVWSAGPAFNSWFLMPTVPSNHLAAPVYATSCYDWALGWSGTSIPFSTIYVGRCPLEIPFLSCEEVVGTDVYNLKLTHTDTGAGADVMMLALRLADPGTGVDVARILLSLADIGAGSEWAGFLRDLTDTGVGLEAYAINLRHTDTGTGAEVSTVGLSMADVGAGVEALVRLIGYHLYEAAAGLDITGLTVVVVDVGSGAETPLLSLRMTETGTGVDVPVIILSVVDAGVAADIIRILYYILESGVGVDVAGVGMVTADTSTGADSVRLILSIAESGVGSEQVSMTIYVTLALLRLLMSGGKLRLDIEGPGA